MTVLVNTAPAATPQLAARRGVENHVHRARYYATERPRPTVVAILEELLAELETLPSGIAGAELEARRLMWQEAKTWWRDAAELDRPWRRHSSTAQIAEDERWAVHAVLHVDCATCTGGKPARNDGYQPDLEDAPVASRCQSDVCAPAWIALVDRVSRFGPVPEVQGAPGATVRVWVVLGDGYAQHTDAVLDVAGWHPAVLTWRGVRYVQSPDADQHRGIRRYQPETPLTVQGVLW